MPSPAFTNFDPKTRKRSYFKANSEHLELLEKHGLVIIDKNTYLVRDELVSHLGAKDDLIHTISDLGYSVHYHNHKEDISAKIKRLFLPRKYFTLPPHKKTSMMGAGIAHRGKRFTTHSTLLHHHTAITTFSPWQIGFTALAFLAALLGIWANPLVAGVTIVAILSSIYFADVIFSLFLVLKSLHFPPELSFTPEQLQSVDDGTLPTYTILCPLYREAHVLPHFIESIEAMDWPKNKLDVQLLLEEDDQPTIDAAHSMQLPKYMRVVVVPESKPKTKPKACNYGLAHAKGEFVVVYDAEDRPDPQQLKKAYLAFLQSPKSVACVQAKLNYYNPHQNLLTRFFTAEYSLWFDVVLPGLQSINTTIPLGGTSNHFRTDVLRKLEGWDAFNVTEDCDLGSRIFKKGFTTVLIDSVTLEEANSRLGNWIRQRSRWIKGYLQTYLVHTRNFPEFIKTHGIHAVIFQLVIGLRMTFMIINPLLWLLTISYFTLHSLVGPTIEAFYPAAVFYMAVISLVFGNFLYLYYYMIGCAKRGAWPVIKWVFLVPVYWFFISIAAWKAFYQLITKPHYWEKTNHGLHIFVPRANKSVSTLSAGMLLIVANAIGNLMYLAYNTYLGRSLTSIEYGIIGLFGSLLYIVNIPISTIGSTLTYRIGYLSGKIGGTAKSVWSHYRKIGIAMAIAFTVLWLIFTPFLADYFHIDSILAFLIFTPVWGLGLLSSLDRSFLNATFSFTTISVAIIMEAGLKLGFAYLFINYGLTEYVYAALPLSMFFPFLYTWFSSRKKVNSTGLSDSEINYFPKKYFSTSLLSNLSSIAFLSLDVIMVKRLLDPESAGLYALISLVGKMVFFGGSLFSQFITPVVSKKEGEGENSRQIFYRLLLATTVVVLLSFIAISLFGSQVLILVFGQTIVPVLALVPYYCLGMGFYTIATSIINFHQVKRHYLIPLASFPFSLVLVFGMSFFDQSLFSVVSFVVGLSLVHLVVILLLHVFYDWIDITLHQFQDFTDLFTKINLFRKSSRSTNKLKILVLNWYDIKHVFAGGAEAYIHQIAKKWVREGHEVTMFTGNDWNNPRHEVIDGVNVVRRGGLYTVAIWAFLYYMLKFRGKFDVVIDIPKGVPFFAPLYAGIPVIGLVHQVHQEMFRTELNFPLKQISCFLEGKAMPFIYKNTPIVSVSKSTQQAVEKLKMGSTGLTIVHPGVEIKQAKTKKTSHPQLLYLGRLRAYKSIDLLLMAAANLRAKYSDLRVIIAGKGEDESRLKKIAKELDIEDIVTFTGEVSEQKKAELFTESWVAVQPSIIEGWGITNIEANACGTVVVAADSEGLRDSVIDGSTGLLFPAGDLAGLEKVLNSILKDKKLRDRLQKSGVAWSKNFGWPKSSADFLDFIKLHLQTRHQFSVTESEVLA